MTRHSRLLLCLAVLLLLLMPSPARSGAPTGAEPPASLYPEDPIGWTPSDPGLERLDLFVVGLGTAPALPRPRAVRFYAGETPVLLPEPIADPDDAGALLTKYWLFRVTPTGALVWERPLGFESLVIEEWSLDRNTTEDALYLLTLGAPDPASGLERIQKYGREGTLEWDVPLATALSSVSANAVFGGAYVADDELGVWRLDARGRVVWGPLDFGPDHPGPAAHERQVSADPWTGGVYVTFHQADGASTLVKLSPAGRELWRRWLPSASRPIANALDGGVYVAAGGPDGARPLTVRYDASGERLWEREDFPGTITQSRALAPTEGALMVSGGGMLGCLAADGAEHWCVSNDDGAGCCFGNLGLAGDLGADAFYTAQDGLAHGVSKYDGITHERLWRLDPGRGSERFRLALGVPARANHAPDVSRANGRLVAAQPVDHTLVPAEILGVTDPEGDELTFRVLGVTQDEPVVSTEPKATCPDAAVVDDVLWLRRENDQPGNGRVYHISFEVTDAKGAASFATVDVCVQGGIGPECDCVDDGGDFGSFGPCIDAAGGRGAEIRAVRVAGGVARVDFTAVAATRADIELFDLQGRVLSATSHVVSGPGLQHVEWNAPPVASGIYFVRVRAGGVTVARRVLLTP